MLSQPINWLQYLCVAAKSKPMRLGPAQTDYFAGEQLRPAMPQTISAPSAPSPSFMPYQSQRRVSVPAPHCARVQVYAQ
jgi:hypothetical protein